MPIAVTKDIGHVAGIPPVTFTGTPVTIPESAVTLDRNTQQASGFGSRLLCSVYRGRPA